MSSEFEVIPFGQVSVKDRGKDYEEVWREWAALSYASSLLFDCSVVAQDLVLLAMMEVMFLVLYVAEN